MQKVKPEILNKFCKKRYYDRKHKKLQRQKDKYMHIKDLVRTHVEIDNRLKALGEKAVG